MDSKQKRFYEDIIEELKRILAPLGCGSIESEEEIYFSFDFDNKCFTLHLHTEGYDLEQEDSLYSIHELLIKDGKKQSKREILDNIVNGVIFISRQNNRVYSAIKLVCDEILLGYGIMYKGLYCLIDLESTCFNKVSERFRKTQNNRSIRRTFTALCESELEVGSITSYYNSLDTVNTCIVGNEMLLNGVLLGVSKRDRVKI